MNRKAQIFILFTTIATGLALLVIFAAFLHKYDNIKPVGTTASSIINTYQQEEASLLYLDLSAQKALKKSLFDLGEMGGFDVPRCGESIYPLWNTGPNSLCLPDYETNLKLIFKNNLGKDIQKYGAVELAYDHTLLVKQNGYKTEITGTTPEKIKISVTSEGEIKQAKASSGAQISQDIQNKMKSYDSVIFQAADAEKIPPALIKAVITQESRGDKYATSTTGCAGIMQFCGGNEGYFGSGTTFQSVTDKCQPKAISGTRNFNCENPDVGIFSSDPRFDPYKAIPAGAKLLKENSDAFKDYADKYAFALGAYNGGAATIKEAIDKTGKKDPSWEEVSQFITPDTLKDASAYYRSSYWLAGTRLENKAKEIKGYVEAVNNFYQAWGGNDLTSGGVIGTFEYEQNFKVDTQYDLGVYDNLKQFATETIKDCNDEVEKCLGKHIDEFNKQHPNEKIMPIEQCEGANSEVFIKLAENIVDCANTKGEKCTCEFMEKYTNQQILAFNNNYPYTYSVGFEKFSFGGGKFSGWGASIPKEDHPQLNPSGLTYPEPRAWVNDYASKLDQTTQTELNGAIAGLEHQTGVEIGIASLQSLGSTSTFQQSQEIFDAWKIGKKDLKNGILIVVSIADKKTGIYVGESLESIFPIDKLQKIIDDNLKNNLEDQKISVGLKKTVEVIITEIEKSYKSDNKGEPHYDIELRSPPYIKLLADLHMINWTPKIFNFRFNPPAKVNIEDIKFTDENSNDYEPDNIVNISLLKRTNDVVFLMQDEDGKIINETEQEDQTRKEMYDGSSECYLSKNIFRLCSDTNQLMPVMDEKGDFSYKHSKIKFALRLDDTIPPSKVENVEVKWLPEIQKVLLTWDEPLSTDIQTFEMCYSNNKFEKCDKNIKDGKFVGIFTRSRREPLTRDIKDFAQRGSLNIQEQTGDASPDGDEAAQTTTQTPIATIDSSKVNKLFFEEIQGPPKKVRYYLLIDIKDIKINESDTFFGVVAVDVSGNRIQKIETLKAQLPVFAGQLIVDYAAEYLNTRYETDKTKIRDCRQESAQADTCRTQCGSFVSSVYRYGLNLEGDDLLLVPRGNGKDKCNGPNIAYRFTNPNELQPGDIFTASSSSGFGHTGIYVGKGTVSQPTNGDKCWLQFTPNPNGEQVVIHSIGPVCYNTLDELRTKQGRTISNFCRHSIFFEGSAP